jgi:hypothetical protein
VAPVLQQAQGKRDGQSTEASCSNRHYNPTVGKLSARPNFNGKDKPMCTNCPIHCHICKAVVRKYGMEHHYSTKLAGIDLLAHFMIGPLERATTCKIRLVDVAVVQA